MDESYPGMFEVPVWQLIDKDTPYSMDYAGWVAVQLATRHCTAAVPVRLRLTAAPGCWVRVHLHTSGSTHSTGLRLLVVAVAPVLLWLACRFGWLLISFTQILAVLLPTLYCPPCNASAGTASWMSTSC